MDEKLHILELITKILTKKTKIRKFYALVITLTNLRLGWHHVIFLKKKIIIIIILNIYTFLTIFK